ncbi:MAG TPA: Calx-beta domain-containing protein [Gemmataceae bacterium]|nr:Calx-beta domain-containing protein [Gemmataceae bacterium]
MFWEYGFGKVFGYPWPRRRPSAHRRRQRRRARRFLPWCEPLEPRILLDGTLPRIQFAVSQLTAPEDTETVQATVTVNPAPTEPGEFYCRVLDGTASEGTDYEPHRGHFELAPGTTSLSIPLAHLIDDFAYEGDETVTFELVPVQGVELGTPATLVLTIQDNDQPPPEPPPPSPIVITPDSLQADQERIAGPGYAVSLASGALSTSYRLPASPAGAEPVELVYNSAAADPRPIFLVQYPLPSTPNVPAKVGARLTLNGTAGPEVFYDTASLSANSVLQIALQGDATGLPTGRYAYQIDVTAYDSTSVTTTFSGEVSLLNADTSPVGDGWSIAGLQRLWPTAGGVILELPEGLSLWFADGSPAGTFLTPAGDFSTLVRHPDGTFTRTLKDGVQIAFDAAGRQTAVTDRNGNTVQYDYDAAGKLIAITDANGLVTALTYAGARVSTITDPAGRVTQLAYDADGRLTAITAPDPDGAGPQPAPVTQFTYNSFDRMTGLTDPRSYTTTFEYNFAGRLALVTRPDTTTEQLAAAQMQGLVAPGGGTWEAPAPPVLANEAVARYLDPRGFEWQARLDTLGFGLAVETTDPLGNTTSYTRDGNGLPTAVTDPLGRTTSYVYDSKGNPTQVTLPDGTVYLYAYNAFSQVTQVTEPDPDGDEGPASAATTRFSYDVAGNLLEYILPDDDTDPNNNPRYVYTYDSQGRRISATDPRNFTTTYSYDSQDRLTEVVYPDDDADPSNNPRVVLSYDAAGNLTSYTDERGFVTFFSYDNLARLVGITYPDDDQDPSNNPQETFGYDSTGNRTSHTDPLGRTTTFAFDSLGRLTSQTRPDPDGAGPQAPSVTTYAYDAAGNLTQMTDPLGRITSLTYDEAGRRTQVRRGASYAIDYEYDGAGQLVRKRDPAPDAGQPESRLITDYAYNARGQVVRISDSLGRLQTFDYDRTGNLIGFA